MDDATRSLVRDPQGVRAGARPTGTAPAIAALALVASTAASDDAVAALADELLDPVAGLAQGARALLGDGPEQHQGFREELLGLMYDRARELHDALVFYDWLVRPPTTSVT